MKRLEMNIIYFFNIRNCLLFVEGTYRAYLARQYFSKINLLIIIYLVIFITYHER